jgi:16S rRNA (uracil1498-N3)-methyltransferase
MTIRLHVPPPLAAGARPLDEAASRYLGRVLRLRPGDQVVVFDGAGAEADATVAAIDAAGVQLSLEAPRLVPGARGPAITLMLALLKGERMDFALQKATELGVARVIPIVTARAVVRLEGDRAEARAGRWSRIVIDAARQCGRADAPEVTAILPFADAVAAAPPAAFRLLLHESAEVPLRRLLPVPAPAEVVVATGPEGGFTDGEVSAARGAGFAVAGLGARVLRAETAAMAAVAILGFALASD